MSIQASIVHALLQRQKGSPAIPTGVLVNFGRPTPARTRSTSSTSRHQPRGVDWREPPDDRFSADPPVATRWIYDTAAKALFTSDMWAHTWRGRRRPVDHRDGDDDPTD
jgi:hypothetical protein